MCHHPSPLVSLPAELQIKVVEELYTSPPCPYEDPLAEDAFLENIKAVRLTCKSLNAAASDVFLKTWFSHRSIVFERKSLLNLYRIATTPPFNKRIAQIDVAAYEFRPELGADFKVFLSRMEREARDESCFLRHDSVKEHFLGDVERKADWPRARSAYAIYKKYADDQAELHQSFVHIRLLARILTALNGTLRTISVNGAQSPLTGAWSSGILRDCGISLLNREKVSLHSATMAAVIRAMHLSRIDVCSLVASGLNVSALELSLPQRRRFNEVGLSHLHHLSLRLLDPKNFPSETNSALFRSGLLGHFIQRAQNLTHLSVEFYNQPFDIPLSNLLGPRMEKLESLCLGGLTYHAQDLIEWLTENRSKLEHIQLDYSSLITGNWRDTFRMMRSNLDLKSVYFHFLADDEESIHITGENVNNFILKKSTKVDWETMESKKLPRNMGDLAGLFSVVVNNHPHHHNHHHHHHNHGHGQNDTGSPPEPIDTGNHDQTEEESVTAGPAPPPDHPSSNEAEAQQNGVVAGPAPPPGHPASNPIDQTPAPTTPTPGHGVNALNGSLTLPMPPPHVMNAMQDLFESALGVSLDFIDDLDEDEDDLSDSSLLDDDDFNDEDESEDDSETEEDDEEDIPDDEVGYDREGHDGYETDDPSAEAIVDQIIKDL
ncbi:Protein transport inhibitor response 1 [Neofusicoccum parvum]|uniref:Protein transport inhibitor response 1 n=1 Tax=Neofusicoccum parvum TaxID=310453 RepID=A0ACB5S2X1_9PEZI|nr:Protein transport inhibitor response 1 [Neofusicoccum parvum]